MHKTFRVQIFKIVSSEKVRLLKGIVNEHFLLKILQNESLVVVNSIFILYFGHQELIISNFIRTIMNKNKKTVPAKQNSSAKSVSSVSSGSSSSFNKKSHPRITPLGDRILLRPFTAEEVEKKNDFGIIIPETVSKERPEQGEIVAVGEGRYEDGKLVPMKVKVGEKVIFSKYGFGFDEVKMDGDELYILKEESILAIIK